MRDDGTRMRPPSGGQVGAAFVDNFVNAKYLVYKEVVLEGGCEYIAMPIVSKHTDSPVGHDSTDQ